MNRTSSSDSAVARTMIVEEYIALSLTALLMPLILTGNLLVLISYKINRRLRTRTYTFLINLAVSDLLVGGVNLPMWLTCMVNYRKCSSFTFQMVFKIFDLFGAFASILHLTAISIERYIAVVKPYSFQQLTQKAFYFVSAFAWAFSLLMASLTWFSAKYFHVKSYNFAVFLIGFAIPAIVVVSMYFGIFKAAKSLTKRTPIFMESRKDSNTVMREDRKVAVTVAVISGLFIIAWLPFFLLSIMGSFCYRECFPENPVDVLRLVSIVKWLHYSNSMVNPIVYALRDLEMRTTFKRILTMSRRCFDQRSRQNSSSNYDRSWYALRTIDKNSNVYATPSAV